LVLDKDEHSSPCLGSFTQRKETPVSVEWVGVCSLSILDVLEKKKKKKKKKNISCLYFKLHCPDLD
jgi:hypothetical protein